MDELQAWAASLPPHEETAPMDNINTSTAAIAKMLDGVTPGPWEWGGYPDDLRLQTVHGGKVFVMTFARKGFRGAQPRFQPQGKGMVDADELLQFQVGDRDVVGEKAARENGSVYRYDVRGIDNPDARFIAAARALVPALSAENADLRAKLDAAVEALDRIGGLPYETLLWRHTARATLAKIKGSDHE